MQYAKCEIRNEEYQCAVASDRAQPQNDDFAAAICERTLGTYNKTQWFRQIEKLAALRLVLV